jgi:HEAT repeat protein
VIRQLKHPAPRTRKEAAIRLKQLSVPAAGPSLIEMLNDVDAEVRTAADQALVEIGVDTRSVARELSAVLWEAYIHGIFAKILPDLIEAVRPPPIVPTSGRGRELPSLPWPPPRFSA